MAEEKKDWKDWEVESACNTLMGAEEIKNNPALYKKALAMMEKKHEIIMRMLGQVKLEKKGSKYHMSKV